MGDTLMPMLQSHCCTCLSKDRKLHRLCRIVGGVNNLYTLLSIDDEAYREGFYTEAGALCVCWECGALLRRFARFRRQACTAQRALAKGIDLLSLSNLTVETLPSHSHVPLTSPAQPQDGGDNFVDCGPVDVKSEPEDADDVPLSRLKGSHSDPPPVSDNDDDMDDSFICNDTIKGIFGKAKHARKNKETKRKERNGPKTIAKKTKLSKESSPSTNKNKTYYSSVELSKEEFLESVEKRKLTVNYVDAFYKCETCIEGFKLKTDLDSHNLAFHTEKPKHTSCDICRRYVETTCLKEHQRGHYYKHLCDFCDYVTYSTNEILRHLKTGHAMQKLAVTVNRKRGQRRTPRVQNPGSKPRRSQALMDKRTPFGYLCTDCNKYFDNKNQRWKHIQRHHREGYPCGVCGKRFAFKSNRARHEAVHVAPPPREKCPTCEKMIRVDLMGAHARTHEQREARSCAACDKTFVSLASYEHHLKYTKAHTTHDILKYKCSQCEKGYRSRGELRDHVNYQHLRKTLHQCPVCGKALATRRCVTRHVRRAHHGVRESARDKVCQLCGKAFRDKKGLREHELIHSGERPLNCELCGAKFRQSASLYTHRRRVHKVAPRNIVVEHTTVNQTEVETQPK